MKHTVPDGAREEQNQQQMLNRMNLRITTEVSIDSETKFGSEMERYVGVVIGQKVRWGENPLSFSLMTPYRTHSLRRTLFPFAQIVYTYLMNQTCTKQNKHQVR